MLHRHGLCLLLILCIWFRAWRSPTRKEIDRLQPLLNGAVITKIFFYENPQQTSAHICVDGIPKEWSLRLARTDTPDYYRIVFSTVTILTTGEMYHRPQVGDPPDGEPC